MDCSNCGATGQFGGFCTRCRTRLTGQSKTPRSRAPSATRRAAVAPARPAERPVVVERLSTLMLLQAAFAAVYVIVVPGNLTYLAMGTLLVLSLLAAIGLRQLKPWGRILGIVYAAVTLLAVPVGTVYGGFLLAYFFKPEVKAAFSGDPASSRLAPQARDLWRPLSVVIGVVNILLVLALAGLAAALTLPGLMR